MQQHKKDDLTLLRKITVAIKQTGTNKILGTGVLVTDYGLIMTCYHVIGIPKNRNIIEKDVDVYFPKAGITKRAQAVEEYSNPSVDVAFMMLHEPLLLPDTIGVATLSESIYPMHHFQSFGFREPKIFEGLYAHGDIQGITAKTLRDTDSSTDVIQLYSDEIGRGMSGAPILDLETERVIGIISDHYKSQNEVDPQLNFGIPVKSIIGTFPDIKKKNRGLVVGDFLGRIKSSNDYYYLNIDYLYVQPREYGDIVRILEHDKVVIITGHPEYGKTYTAVRLLWEHYNKGYVPFLVEVEDRKLDLGKQTNELRRAMQSEKIIVYLNDPFGKNEYNKDSDVESINDLINEFRNQDNSYLLITTRDKIYNKIKNTEFKSFKSVVRFEIDKPSYDHEKRMELLLMHARYKGCNWFSNNSLRTLVLTWLEERDLLPTLLNIHDFTSATVKVADKEKLREIMEIKSRKTPESFSQEIQREHYDLMNFLSFPFISDWFSVNFVRTEYNELIKSRKYKDRYQFEKIALLFNDKISTEGYVRFRHPSYSEALSYILENDIDTAEDRQESNEIVEDFSNVINRLLKKPNAIRNVIRTIARYYRHLSPDIRKLLIEMVDDPRGLEILPYAITDNFKNLKGEVDLKVLLDTIAEKKSGELPLIYALAQNLEVLPMQLINELILKLSNSGNPAVMSVIARIVYDNFYLIEAPTRNVLIEKLADSPFYDGWRARLVIRYYESLEPKIRDSFITLANRPDSTVLGTNYLINNFDSLPPKIREFILSTSITLPSFAEDIAENIISDFHTIAERVRNELVRRLAEIEDAVVLAAEIIVHHYDFLPSDIQKSSLTIIRQAYYKYEYLRGQRDQEDEDSSRMWHQTSNIAITLAEVYDNLNPSLQELLFELREENPHLRNKLNGDNVQSLEYHKKALELDKKLGYRPTMARDHSNIGDVLYHKRNYDQALEYHKKALELHEELGNRVETARDKLTIAGDYRGIANIFYHKRNYDQALEYHKKALELHEEIGNRVEMYRDYKNIINLFYHKRNYDQALEYHKKALELDKNLSYKPAMARDKLTIAGDYRGIANIFYHKRNYDQALEYHKKALELHEELGNKVGMARDHSNIGDVLYHKRNYDQALEYHKKALELHEELLDGSFSTGIFVDISDLRYNQYGYDQVLEYDSKSILGIFNQLNYDQALEYHKKALELHEELGNKVGMAEDYMYIAIILERAKSPETAIESFSKGLKLFQELEQETSYRHPFIYLIQKHILKLQ
jgi:tetratricopeptide (TPR) repeat protein